MKKFLLLLFLMPFTVFAQPGVALLQKQVDYSDYFYNAYLQFPNIPHGILEAVAYGNTHISHITHIQGQEESCIGLPMAYGVMGLTLDGKQYFNNNLIYVSNLSGIAVEEIIASPEKNILSYANAFNTIMSELENQKSVGTKPEEIIFNTLLALSELPQEDEGQMFAVYTQLYSYFWFLEQAEFQAQYNFQNPDFDLQTLFGEENYKVLSSDHVLISEDKITDTYGNVYKSIGGNSAPTVQSTDYAPAIWNQAATCNFSSRTQSITAIVIHDVEGSYSSCISWFKNCNAGVSAHYVVRSSDGQVTQMVLESKKAWHVGTENGYTIGIEHEGYAAQTGWYTNAMLQSSANLVKDICNSGYGINPATAYNGPSCNCHATQSSSVKIRGHQHYPNTGKIDPGVNWPWTTFYNLINNTTTTCGTPTGLSTSSISSTGATLSWTAVPGAVSYNVIYSSSNGVVNTSSTASSLALSGLNPSTTYQFKVQAVCAQSSLGAFSSLTSFSTGSLSSSTNTTITIGTATTPYSAHPFGTVYMDERVQYIFTKAELTAAGWSAATPYLKSLAFNVSSAAPQAMANFKITIAHTTGTSFSSTSFLTGTNGTVVYTGTKTANQAWNTFAFATPFQYNGTSSLLVTICWDNSSFTVNSAVLAKSYPNYVALYYRADLSGSGPCAKTTGIRSFYRPNSKLEFSNVATITMSEGNSQNSPVLVSDGTRSFEIFPNPLNGNVLSGMISDLESPSMTLKVYDMLGRELMSESVVVAGGNFTMALADEILKTGIYTVVGITEAERFTKRLVVK